MGVAQKQGSGIREDDSSKSFSIISGIELQGFLVMKPWLSFRGGKGYDGGRWFEQESESEIVLGFEAAEYEQRKIGDSFYVSVIPQGQTESVLHEYKVVGILERTGTQDDGTAFMPISAAQKLFNRPGQLTIVGIKLKEFSGTKLREFENRWIKLSDVQVVGLQQVKTTMVSLVGTAQTMVAAVAAIAIIVAVIGVVNTILMSVYERTGGIGIMKAIGAYRGDIFQLIWYETLAVCFVGAVVGCGLAIIGSRGVEAAIKSLIDLGVQGSIVRITPAVIGYAMVGAIALGFFAGLYPAWRAASMRPIDAIRAGE